MRLAPVCPKTAIRPGKPKDEHGHGEKGADQARMTEKVRTFQMSRTNQPRAPWPITESLLWLWIPARR